MSATVAHVLSAVLLSIWTTVYAVQFLVWWLDNNMPPPRECLFVWPLKGGRLLVQWVDDGVEHYAVGSDDTWEAADVMCPPPLARGDPITDPSTVRYLWTQWDADEERKRQRAKRRARRARWEKRKQIEASVVGSGGSSPEPQTEPRVLSSSWDGSSTS